MDESRPTLTYDVAAEHQALLSLASCTDKAFEEQMFEKYGPIIADEILARILGFASSVTLRRAIERGKVPLQLFQIGTARTRFALTLDVSRLILSARHTPSPTSLEITEEDKLTR